jgi:hypothetical protein
MRTLLCICYLAICPLLSWGQAPYPKCALSGANQDRYSLVSMKSALDLAEAGLSFSLADLAVQNNGDGMSVAILKLVPTEQLTTPKFVKGYLSMARTAFSNPEATLCDEDRRPDVTLLLLDHLHNKVTDADLRTQIESTQKFVLDKTKSVAANSTETRK